MQLAQRRHSQLLAQRQALRRIESRALLIDRVQRRDAAQRLLGDRTAAGGVHVEELAPDVGQAGQFGGTVGKQGFVAHVIVHHQVAAPAMQEGARVGAGAAGLVVEHDDGRAAVVHAGAVGPQIGVAGLAASRVELSHRGFVGVQAIMLPQQFGEPVGQRLQRHADAADPLGQCRASRQYALAGGDLFDPVQRQMVEVFAGRDPRQQADGGHAAIDDGRRDHSGRHCLGRTAGVLRTDVAVHEEARRFHVQLFADVFADLDQLGAALAALARFGFMAVLDARQSRWQRLAAGALATRLGRHLGLKFLLDGGQVRINRFLEQQALRADERLAGLAEADPAVVGQLVRQRGDLEVLLGQLDQLLREQRLHLRQQGWIDLGAGKFVEQVHAR